jgi:hypothetical protein
MSAHVLLLYQQYQEALNKPGGVHHMLELGERTSDNHLRIQLQQENSLVS